jgi:hypothetical protein
MMFAVLQWLAGTGLSNLEGVFGVKSCHPLAAVMATPSKADVETEGWTTILSDNRVIAFAALENILSNLEAIPDDILRISKHFAEYVHN